MRLYPSSSQSVEAASAEPKLMPQRAMLQFQATVFLKLLTFTAVEAAITAATAAGLNY